MAMLVTSEDLRHEEEKCRSCGPRGVEQSRPGALGAPAAAAHPDAAPRVLHALADAGAPKGTAQAPPGQRGGGAEARLWPDHLLERASEEARGPCGGGCEPPAAAGRATRACRPATLCASSLCCFANGFKWIKND